MRRSIDLGDDLPILVCLVGSSKFKAEHEEAQMRETLLGKIVLPLGMYGHLIPGFDMTGPIKAKLDRLHLKKIDLSDEVLVVNPGGYIGESSRSEIQYAISHLKDVVFWDPPTERFLFLDDYPIRFPSWRAS